MLAGNERLMGMNYYVTMTEIYYSRSKQSKGKIAKFIFICDFYNEAEVVADNARQIGTMDAVSICTTRPHYTRYNHCIAFANKQTSPNWYIPGYFFRRSQIKYELQSEVGDEIKA
jgi:hypothetical protein